MGTSVRDRRRSDAPRHPNDRPRRWGTGENRLSGRNGYRLAGDQAGVRTKEGDRDAVKRPGDEGRELLSLVSRPLVSGPLVSQPFLAGLRSPAIASIDRTSACRSCGVPSSSDAQVTHGPFRAPFRTIVTLSGPSVSVYAFPSISTCRLIGLSRMTVMPLPDARRRTGSPQSGAQSRNTPGARRRETAAPRRT